MRARALVRLRDRPRSPFDDLGLSEESAAILAQLIDGRRHPNAWTRQQLDDLRYGLARAGYGFVRLAMFVSRDVQMAGECMTWLRANAPQIFERGQI